MGLLNNNDNIKERSEQNQNNENLLYAWNDFLSLNVDYAKQTSESHYGVTEYSPKNIESKLSDKFQAMRKESVIHGNKDLIILLKHIYRFINEDNIFDNISSDKNVLDDEKVVSYLLYIAKGIDNIRFILGIGKFPGKNDGVDILNVYIGNMKLISSINESVSFDIKVDK